MTTGQPSKDGDLLRGLAGACVTVIALVLLIPPAVDPDGPFATPAAAVVVPVAIAILAGLPTFRGRKPAPYYRSLLAAAGVFVIVCGGWAYYCIETSADCLAEDRACSDGDEEARDFAWLFGGLGTGMLVTAAMIDP